MHASRCILRWGERSQGSDITSYTNTALNQQFPLWSPRQIKAWWSTVSEHRLEDLGRGRSQLLWYGIVKIKLLITKAYFNRRTDAALMSAIRFHLLLQVQEWRLLHQLWIASFGACCISRLDQPIVNLCVSSQNKKLWLKNSKPCNFLTELIHLWFGITSFWMWRPASLDQLDEGIRFISKRSEEVGLDSSLWKSFLSPLYI